MLEKQVRVMEPRWGRWHPIQSTEEQEQQYIQILELLDCAKRTTSLESAWYQDQVTVSQPQDPPSAVLTTSPFRSLNPCSSSPIKYPSSQPKSEPLYKMGNPNWRESFRSNSARITEPCPSYQKILVELFFSKKNHLRNLGATRLRDRRRARTNPRRIKWQQQTTLTPKPQMTTLHSSSQFLNELQPQRPLRTVDHWVISPLPPPFQSKSGLLPTRDPRREEESKKVNMIQSPTSPTFHT